MSGGVANQTRILTWQTPRTSMQPRSHSCSPHRLQQSTRGSSRAMRAVGVSQAAWALDPLVLVLGGCTSHPTSTTQAHRLATTRAHRLATSARSAGPTKSTASAVAVGAFNHRSVFGHSVRGRELVEFRAGPVNAHRRVLAVGVIHGNETGVPAIAQDLLRTALPVTTEVFVVTGPQPRRRYFWDAAESGGGRPQP
jgi:hypothetical protein